MAAANKVTVRKLRVQKSNEGALIKYSSIGKMFSPTKDKSNDYYIDFLLSIIETWTKEMDIPGLAQGGVKPEDLERIASGSDNKNNPVSLDKDEMMEVLEIAS